MKKLDLITVGRTSVDLYGDQIGEQLKDMASFSKYVGGSPTNTAIGAAKLGLKVGHITKVGAEALGQFIIESLQSFNVDTEGVSIDPDRLTSTTVLGIDGREKNTLVYFRENCADAHLDRDDIDPHYLAAAAAILISGTMLYTPACRQAVKAILDHTDARPSKVILDVDYRPRFLNSPEESQKIAERTRSILDRVDLLVGTKEELSWLAAEEEELALLRKLRSLTEATIVLKVGADGCLVFPAEIPADPGMGLQGKKFKVAVCNVFGAGDAFMGGFLRGWLTGQPLETCMTWGNACGAIVVSRHGCSPESPSWPELQYFLGSDFDFFDLDQRTRLDHIHWATSLRPQGSNRLKCLAMDHQWQFDELMQETGKTPDDVIALKKLIFEGFSQASQGHGDVAVLMDDTYCEDLILAAAASPFTIARRTEKHYRSKAPAQFLNGAETLTRLRRWPRNQIAKMLVFFHRDDSDSFKKHQLDRVAQLYAATRETGRQLLLEPIPSFSQSADNAAVSEIMEAIYQRGVMPDWWKIEVPESPEAWKNIIATMQKHDPYCRGLVLLGKHNSIDAMQRVLEQSSRQYDQCAGFVVGRPVFWQVAEAWMKDRATDGEVVDQVRNNFTRLLESCTS